MLTYHLVFWKVVSTHSFVVVEKASQCMLAAPVLVMVWAIAAAAAAADGRLWQLHNPRRINHLRPSADSVALDAVWR